MPEPEAHGQSSDRSNLSRRVFLGGASLVTAATLTQSWHSTSASAAPRPRHRRHELPPPTPANSFYLLPLADEFAGSATPAQFRTEMRKMLEQFGGQRLYQRLGFSFIPRGRDQLMSAAQVAHELGASVGPIMPYQCHSGGAQVTSDLRTYQWRMDGKTWQGVSTDARDHDVPSPSRYNTATRDLLAPVVADWAADVQAVMDAYPGVITVINGVIEEELATGGQQDPYLADYSPFAIAEFRDWLTHRGAYDLDGGRYAGQGAPEQIVGPYRRWRGQWRSPFYPDPSPDRAHHRGRSFNDWFGTQFRTWALRYWDLDTYPDPITDHGFDPSPQAGTGFTPDGFDAPRTRAPQSRYWNAWSWDYPDHDNTYPPGNPAKPAFGYRQFEVHHFVIDMFDLLVAAGLPRALMFAHQIPGEVVSGDGMGAGAPRCRSSASPLWTGYLPMNGHLGVTRFGPIDTTMLTRYSNNWGIFEWHVDPLATPDSQELYAKAHHDLNDYFAHRAHYLFPGWWDADGKIDPTFPLNDSTFAVAIKDFLAHAPDVPYSRPRAHPSDFTPPPVSDVTITPDVHTQTLSWSNRVWPDYPDTWQLWSQFKEFEVAARRGRGPWRVTTTTESSMTFDQHDRRVHCTYRVRARTVSGHTGPWVQARHPHEQEGT